MLQINLAQSMNLKEFHLDGRKTQLGLQTGFFFVSRVDDTFTSCMYLCKQRRCGTMEKCPKLNVQD
jgi:hypothetical protein